MSWWQAILLGIVQGLTEFLPVSSSGHLVIFRELLGIDGEGFLDFTVAVHCATVLATLVVFWPFIWRLLKGLLRFRLNDETDYVLKLIVSMIPVAFVGLALKDEVEALFGDSLFSVATFLLITAVLLVISDQFSVYALKAVAKGSKQENTHRNGVSYLQAFIVGIGQAFAVAPGLSRSGATISMGLIFGVKREVIAEFSFLMVLIPVIGEQLLSLLECFSVGGSFASGIGILPLSLAFVAAFFSGLFACKSMVALVRKSKLGWFALYCGVVAFIIFLFF